MTRPDGRELRRQPLAQRRGIDRGDARLVAEHRRAQRLAREGGGLEMIEDDVVGRVARLAQLGQHDALLALELVGVEMRLADEIGDHVDARARDRSASRRAWNTVWSRAVQALSAPPASSIVSAIAARIARTRALEHHMLDHVGEAAEPAPARSALPASA